MLFIRFFIVAILLFVWLPDSAYGQVARKRIALNGSICKSIIGVPKWAADRTVNNHGEPGDLILLKTQANPGEALTVGAYLYYRKVRNQGNNNWVNLTDWEPVPTSPLGTEWGYRSNTLRTAGAWARFSNPERQAKDMSVQVFMPYAAYGLPLGDYRLRYRIRVWTGSDMLDDFFTNEDRVAQVVGGNQYRDTLATCAAPNGPSVCDFSLIDTLEPTNP